MSETQVVEKPKRNLGKKAMVVIAGLMSGGVGAVGIQYSVGVMVPAAVAAERAKEPEPMEYVDLDTLTVPLSDSDGELVSYVKIGASFEVPEGTTEDIKNKLPEVMHEVNLVTWHTALSKGPNGKLVDVKIVQKILREAAKQVYGDGAINRVLVTSTIPA